MLSESSSARINRTDANCEVWAVLLHAARLPFHWDFRVIAFISPFGLSMQIPLRTARYHAAGDVLQQVVISMLHSCHESLQLEQQIVPVQLPKLDI